MILSQRFTALDVFRGLTICFMIIVNTPGSWDTVYAPLLHAQWHGFTPTDLVFPSFLFAVGNALSFVMTKWASQSNGYVIGKILKRTFFIFLLGYLLYWFPFFKMDKDLNIVSFPISQTRIMGVLQRIALCYGTAAFIIHFFKIRATVLISVLLLIGYWMLMLFLGDAGNEYALTGNIGYKLDLLILGANHVYRGEGVPFDPEGLAGTLPAIVNVIAGYLVGRLLQVKGKTYKVLAMLVGAGIALIVLAYCWNFYFPINKKLWTSSYVLLTIGLDCVIIACIIYVIDFLRFTKWTPFFEIVGKNPLFIYLLSEILVIILFTIHINKETNLYQWLYTTIFLPTGAYLGSFLFALSFMLLCWLVGYGLDKKKIYVRV